MRKTSVLVLVALLALVSVQAFAVETAPTFLRSWGEGGVDDGQFNLSRGVAVDVAGNVYVADSWNNRIQKFDRYGNFLLKWGTAGTGDGQFSEPRGVAVDMAGNFYVADTGNHRIQKFKGDGTFLVKWGAYSTGDGQFHGPRGLAVDTAGNVYVADTGNHRIQKFASDGTFVRSWGKKGAVIGEFNTPHGVAVDTNGNVYVADTLNDRIQKFDADLGTWEEFGNSDITFSWPEGVAVDTAGNVYVADTGNHRIQKFAGDGIFLVKWGENGTGEGQFFLPSGVAIDPSGNVYVADYNLNRIQKFGEVNDPPVLDPIGAQSVSEGTELTFTATASDPDLPANALTFSLVGAPEGASIGDSSGVFSWTPPDDGSFTFTVKVCDDGDPSLCDEEEITVNGVNQPPTADAGGPYLAAINAAISCDGSGSSDPDGDPLTYAWDFGDGGAGTGATPTHSYAAAAIYDVCLTVNDGTLDSDPACALAVVYDPSAGFVTGGGWIDSPVGAYIPDPDLSGKATFGFVSKYKKGASVPEGSTEFQFQAGGFNFHSAAYQWLVVDKAGLNAQFKGSGTVNGGLAPDGNEFKFMIWATDSTPDTFRIRVWWEDADATEHVMYDNGFNQAIGGGSIVVHTK